MRADPTRPRPRLALRSLRVAAATLALALLAGSAHAADPMAESMFQQGIAMMREGRFEEARRALEASQKLEAKSGTLLVLASCDEQLGRTATAWAGYKEAAALARTEGRAEHVTKATDLARNLEPRLSKIRIDTPTQGGVQLTVKLDGATVLDGALGVAFAIDPGSHVVEASAPGRVTWSATLTVKPGHEEVVVAVPELAAAPIAPPPQRGPAPTPAPAPPYVAPSEASRPVWPWIVGGAGVVVGSVGLGFGVDQRAAASELDDQCGASRASCPDGYDFEADRAREERGQSLFIGLGLLGLGGIGAGIIGLATTGSESGSGSAKPLAPTVAVGLGTAEATVRF